MKAHAVLLFIFLAIGIAQAAWGSNAKDKVRLDQVSTLTLRKNAYTSGRRSSPVPQLNCVGGGASSRAYEIETVQCENKGSDGYDIQWKCEADMDSNLRFGKVEVTCEGYDYPEDPYVLRGSCGLEYTLEYTNQGKQQQHYQQNQQQNQHHSSYHYSQQDHGGGGFKLKTLLMVGVVIFIFYNIYRQCAQMGAQPGAGAGAGAGQWGPGGPGMGGYPPGNWGPGGPPPGSGPGYGSGPYYGGGSCAPPPPPPTSSWRPGFWTGLAAGGFMGNMFNRPRYGSYGSYGPRYSTPTFSSGPSFSSGGGSSSSSRTASGFGGTRRR